MNYKNWKYFNKLGGIINLSPEPFINITVSSDTAYYPADIYAITNYDASIVDTYVWNKGWGFDGNLSVYLNDLTSDAGLVLIDSSNYSITLVDVSVFDPDGRNTKAIESLNLNIDSSYYYPSLQFTGSIFLEPISQGLVQTEQIYIVEILDNSTLFPYSNEGSLVARLEGEESQIKLYNVNYDTQEIIWTSEIEYDISQIIYNNALCINIGFKAEDEGVFERNLRLYHKINGVEYLINEIIVNAESIGEDKRLRTLMDNFGLPDPINFPTLFKEADINESLPDFKALNANSKLLLVEYQNIIPFIGTYKGLINAIKWLGYNDVYFREWYKKISTGEKVGLKLSYDALERSQTILGIPIDDRRNLKKTNALSMHYCLTRETGEFDQWGVPEVSECYNFTIDEVIVKLSALKDWLEKNIIGLNCRITDITGDAIYFERFLNSAYATTNKGNTYFNTISLTPITLGNDSELVSGDSSIVCTLNEFYTNSIDKSDGASYESIEYIYDPSNGIRSFNLAMLDDASLMEDPSTVFIGPPIQYALPSIKDIEWKVSVNKGNGVIGEDLVRNPLFVFDNDLRFYNILDTSTQFFDSSTRLTILLEEATLRDPSIDIWADSIAYRIYPETDPSYLGDWWIEASSGTKWKCNSWVALFPEANSELIYEFDSNYKVPLLTIKNYSFLDSSNNFNLINKRFFLDIQEGKIIMNSGINQTILNFTYDASTQSEQTISIDKIYRSQRMPLFQYDPSIYLYAIQNDLDPSISIITDNSTYTFTVNDIGNYNIEVFAYDLNNIPYPAQGKETYRVWIKYPTIYSYIDTSCQRNGTCSSTYISLDDISTLISLNSEPIYDTIIPLQGVELIRDDTGKLNLKVPNLSPFVNIPQYLGTSKFINLTERCVSIASSTSLIVDTDYQTFNLGDLINILVFDTKKYSIRSIETNKIINISSSLFVFSIPISSDVLIDSCTAVYIQNIQDFPITNIYNDYEYKTAYITTNTNQFKLNQLINVQISDINTSKSWAAAYRIIDTSGTDYVLDNLISDKFYNNQTGYTFKCKHAFTTYAEFSFTNSNRIYERTNAFYLDFLDDCNQRLYIDNTFELYNIPFDQEYVNTQWFARSTDSSLLISPSWYGYNKPIEVDSSTLVILEAKYTDPNYLENQKTIWEIYENRSNRLVMRVFNDIVPFIFNESNDYNIKAYVYDKWGNLILEQYDGLISVQ